MLGRMLLTTSRTSALLAARPATARSTTLAVSSVLATPAHSQQIRALANVRTKLDPKLEAARPLSPHVMIYAFPFAAISSVTHRITGGLTAIGMYGVALDALCGGDVAEHLYQLGSTPVIGPLAKAAVAFPLVYHTLGGVRHLYWERAPAALHQDTQHVASQVLFASSGLITLAAMAL